MRLRLIPQTGRWAALIAASILGLSILHAKELHEIDSQQVRAKEVEYQINIHIR